MEWVAEGLALIFLGVLPGVFILAMGPSEQATRIACRAAAAMLLVMASWTAVTGARTAIVPIKLCPVVKGISAACLLLGSLA